MAGHNKFDVFISHASEDKSSVARPLAIALQKGGLRVWYDEFTLRVGDSLGESIDRGIKNSRFGLVVLSPSFFKKKWTKRELDGLTTQELRSGKKILPIWHNLTASSLARFSPTLAGKVAVSTKQGMKKVISEIERAIRIDESLESSLIRSKLKSNLIAHLKDFLIELGVWFRYIDSNVPITIDGLKRSIDLLFYHTQLKSYLVIELSTTAFEPELAGKMLFLTGAVDTKMKKQNDSPTLGLILCTSKNQSVVESTLRNFRHVSVSKYSVVDPVIRRIISKDLAKARTK